MAPAPRAGRKSARRPPKEAKPSPEEVRHNGGGAEAVSWRDGVHITDTPIWCDARRARDVCFVSASDRPVRANHGQLVATRETLVQLASASGDHLAVPYRRPFTLGEIKIELVPTGHAFGSAGLFAEYHGRRVLYAGTIAGRHAGLAELAELRPCDALVIDAPYGERSHDFPPAIDARGAVTAWAAEEARRRVAVVMVTSAVKGLDVVAALLGAGLEVIAHRAVHHVAQRLRTAGVAPAALVKPSGELAFRRPPSAGVRPGRALVWIARDRERLAAACAPGVRRVALASGLATEREAVAAFGADAAFAWSNAADRDELVELARGSGASRVFVTGRCAVAGAAAIGDTARVLGPPRQMGLFED